MAMTDADVALLAETFAEAGEDVEALSDIESAATEPLPFYGLSPVSPDELAEHGDAVPYSIDLTVPYEGPGAMDQVDRAAVAAVAAQRDDGVPVIALWRAWRFPAADTQWPPPRRVYLLEAGDGAVLPVLVARTQDALQLAGEKDPQVEAFADPDALPVYQRTALGFSTLLWTAAPPVVPQVARVYNTFEPEHGPGFTADHPRLGGEERDRVLAYLAGGAPLLITSDRRLDVVEPSAGEVVPTGFFTDGRWIWSDAMAYYLRVHGLAPDPDLLATIRGNDYEPPEVDAVALHRALSVLYRPVAGQTNHDDPADREA
ncbi:hypothetical protein C1I95_11235 [Micromonospora craterilacus]|uniref:Uncharacterized protein n=1 Tax=Micromonospora craterilacus TaxID=1655439 RepID=A0A2W2ESB5_9ACTN|nr:hypothetical protein C1I95_11235 [Micromonospora craterilacus]